MSKKIKPLTGKFGDFSGIVLKAAASGHLDAVKHYLKINPEWLNEVGPHGRTLLWEAAYKGRLELVAWLIDEGADITAIGSYYTPMHVELSALAAAQHAGRDATVALLRKHGANDDFYAACHRGDIDAMGKFVSRKKSIINLPICDAAPTLRMGYHPIHYAVVGGHVEAVKYLIDKGARVAEHLPLLLDWCEINRSVIAPLIKKQAENEKPGSTRRRQPKPGIPLIDQPDWLGFPELVDACRGNHNATDDPARVSALLDRGANIDIKDHKGKSALHRASQAGFIKITQLLVDRGADLESADEKQETPIYDAIKYGRIETLKLLLKNSVDIERRNFRGDTPIFAAARGKNFEVFKLLCDAKADRSHVNDRNESLIDVLSRKMIPERRKMAEFLSSAKSGSRRKPRKKA